MNGPPVKIRGYFDSRDQIETLRPRQRSGHFVAGEGIVIGDRERFEICRACGVDKLRGRKSTVRLVGMTVKIDQL